MVAEAWIAHQRVPTFTLSTEQTHGHIPAKGSSGKAAPWQGAAAALWEQGKLSCHPSCCRAFAGDFSCARSHIFSCSLLAWVAQPVAPLHTVTGDKTHSWDMGNEATQRRPSAGNREVLPRYQTLSYLKSLTYIEELYLFF